MPLKQEKSRKELLAGILTEIRDANRLILGASYVPCAGDDLGSILILVPGTETEESDAT